jgi:hypothetical protein
MADNQNKAISVFTAAATVFLSLSFFTSYFAMNPTGMRNTEYTGGVLLEDVWHNLVLHRARCGALGLQVSDCEETVASKSDESCVTKV